MRKNYQKKFLRYKTAIKFHGETKMKISKEELVKIIKEEVGLLEGDHDDPMDPNTPLKMTKALEMFIENVLMLAEKELGIDMDDKESDHLYSLLLTQMDSGTELAAMVAMSLIKLWKDGNRGKHSDPLKYQ